MKQSRLDDYPELRAAVEAAERVQAAIRAARRRCVCECHNRDDWDFDDCPVCGCGDGGRPRP